MSIMILRMKKKKKTLKKPNVKWSSALTQLANTLANTLSMTAREALEGRLSIKIT